MGRLAIPGWGSSLDKVRSCCTVLAHAKRSDALDLKPETWPLKPWLAVPKRVAHRGDASGEHLGHALTVVHRPARHQLSDVEGGDPTDDTRDHAGAWRGRADRRAVFRNVRLRDRPRRREGDPRHEDARVARVLVGGRPDLRSLAQGRVV